MKKFLIGFLVLAAFGSPAFAEITFSGGGRLIFVPFAVRFPNTDIEDGDNNGSRAMTYFGVDNPWNGNGPRLQLSVKGSHANGHMGYKIGLNLEEFYMMTTNSRQIIDDSAANLWLRPFGGAAETLQFTFGIFQVDDLRYKFSGAGSGFHNYEQYIRGDLVEEDDIFARFKSNGFGTHIQYKPIEALYIGWAIGSVDKRIAAGQYKDNGWVDTIVNSQLGFGYTISGIGMARLSYFGPQLLRWDDDSGWDDPDINSPLQLNPGTTSWGKIQAAFNLTAMQGLNLDVGFSIPIGRSFDEPYGGKNGYAAYQQDMFAGLGFDLTKFNPFRLWVNAGISFGGYRENYTSTHPKSYELDADGNFDLTKPIAPYYKDNDETEKTNFGTNFAISLTPMYTVAPNNIVGLDLFVDVRVGSDEPAFGNSSNPTQVTGARGGDNDPTWLYDPNRDPDAKNNYVDMGFGVWYRRNIAGGDVRVGVTMKIPGIALEGHEGAMPQLLIPIMFNYNF